MYRSGRCSIGTLLVEKFIGLVYLINLTHRGEWSVCEYDVPDV